jgi:hypothetical protein
MLLVEKKTTVGARMRKSTTIRRFFPLFFKGWSIHFKTSLRGVKPAVGVVKLLSTVSIYSFLSSRIFGVVSGPSPDTNLVLAPGVRSSS